MSLTGHAQSGRPARSSYSLGWFYGLAAVISLLIWAVLILAIRAIT
jgi:hypothetical protein